MKIVTLVLSSLLMPVLCAGALSLSPGCNSDSAASPGNDAGAPGGDGSPGTPGKSDGGMGDGGQQNIPQVAGSITLQETLIQAGGFMVDLWSAKGVLRKPVAPGTVETMGECTIVNDTTAAKPGMAYNAGDLTISGGPNGDLVLQFDATLGIYTPPLAEPTGTVVPQVVTAGTPLFAADSKLSVKAQGGPDLKRVDGMWQGVTSLQLQSPTALLSLPKSGGLPLSWTADAAAGHRMEVALIGQNSIHALCTASDSGSYTVPQAVLARLPTGNVTLLVSRVFSASAQTDQGALQVESRSSRQFTTQQM